MRLERFEVQFGQVHAVPIEAAEQLADALGDGAEAIGIARFMRRRQSRWASWSRAVSRAMRGARAEAFADVG